MWVILVELPGPTSLWSQKSRVESVELAGEMVELLEKVGSQLEKVVSQLERAGEPLWLLSCGVGTRY